MKKNLLSLLLALSFIGLANKVKANIIIAAQSGQFRTGSTWVGGVVPGGSDIAIIPAGITVTFVVDETTPPNDTNHYDPWDNPVLYIYGTYVELSAQYGGTGNGSAAQRLNAANNTFVLSGGIFEDNNYIGDIFLGGSAIYIYSGGQFELGPNIYTGYKSAIFYYNNNGQGVTSPTPATLPLDGSPVSSLPAFFSGPFQMKSDISANPATINTNTPPAAPPVAITNAATSVTATTATFNGTIYPASATTTASFDWGTSSTLAGSTNVTATTPASGNVTTGSASTATAYTLATGLSANSIYYFRAKGVNPTSSTGANISSFVTEIPTASSVASTSFTVNWAAVSGATGYRLDVANDNAFTSILSGYNNLTVSGTSQSVTGLTAGSTYYFRIRVVSSAGTSGNSGIGVQHLDIAPILATGSTLSYTENGAAAAINTAIGVNDVDNTTQASATISITTNFASGQDILSFTNDGSTMGNIAISTNTSGVLTLVSAGSTATLAQWQSALRAVAYSNSSDNPSTAARTVSFTINDGALNSNTVTSTINVTAVNDAPVLANTSTLTYTENGAAASINTAITATDADNTTQASATVTITNFVSGQDVLSFTNNGITMSNIAINTNASGVLTLTSSGSVATLAQWLAALHAIKYSNSSDNPSITTRSVTFTINDGALNSNTITSTINIIPVDDAPVLATGSTLSYTENGAAAPINTLITVSDIDNSTQASATVIITNFVAGQDVLAFTNDGSTMGNIAIGSNTSGVLTLTAAGNTATLANWQSALRSVAYSNSSDNPSTAARTVSFTINDGTLNSNAITSTVNVTAVDDAAVLANSSTLTYTENGAAAAINTLITVNDADNTTQASATVTITNFVFGQDVLSFTNDGSTMGNIAIGTNASGVLTLASAGSSATLAQWQAALQAVKYSNSSDNPLIEPRTVSFTISDGSLNSNTVTSTIHIIPVDDAPVLATGSTLSYTENGAAAPINTLITVSDIDNTTQASANVTITNFVAGQDVLAFTNDGSTMGNIAIGSNTSGVLTLTSAGNTATLANWQSALRSVAYSNSSDNPSTAARTVSFVVNDATLSSNIITNTINVTTVNDAPILAGTATANYTQGGTAAAVAAAITVSDVDNTNLASAIVTISGGFLSGDLLAATTTGTTITASYSAGVLTLSGSDIVAHYQQVLQSVVYSSSSQDPTNSGADNSRTISFTANDGSLNSNTATATVNITAVDQAPVLANFSIVSYTEAGTAVVVNPGITVSDVDNLNMASATVTVRNFISGDVLAVTVTGNITQSYDSSSGILTLSGSDTRANYQQVLRSATYSSTSQNPTVLNAIPSRNIVFTVNDGTLTSNQFTNTVNITAVDNAPVLDGTGTASYTQGGTAAAVAAAITAADVDNNNLSSATVTISGGLLSGDLLAAITTGTSITATYNAGTGALTLSGADRVANYQEVLQSVAYSSSSQNPTNFGADLSRTISFTANDGSLNSNTATATVNITAVDQAPPVLANFSIVSYTEAGTAVIINTGITVSDANDLNMASAVVTVRNFISGDVLAVTVTGNITQSYDSSLGILTLSGSDTKANYQQVLQSVTYSSTSQNPTVFNAIPSRSISFTVNDGTLNSNQFVNTVNITTVDNAPVLAGTGKASYTQGGTAAVVAAVITAADVDNNNLTSATVTISGGFLSGDLLAAITTGTSITATYNAGTGILTLSGADRVANYQEVLQSVAYSSGSQNPTNSGADNSRTISFTANDGSLNSNTATATVNIIYQPTVIAATTLNVNYVPGSAAIAVAPDATITAGSAPIQLVAITGAASADVLAMPPAGNLTAAYNPVLGLIISGTGTAAQYQAALRTVTFQTNSTTGGQRALTVSDLDQNGVSSNYLISANINVIDVTLTPSAATAITSTTASLGYTITNPGGEPISDQGMVYSTNSALTNSLAIAGTIADTIAYTKAAFPAGTTTVTGLLSNTTYYAAAYATNANGITVYSPVITFTTPYQPAAMTATTLNVNDITGSAPINIAPDAIITAGTAPILSVKITGTLSGDVLAMPPAGSLTAAYNPVLGLIISGTGTAAEYQAALRTVTFQTSSTAAGQRVLTVSAVDQRSIQSNQVNLANVNVVTPPAVTTSAAADITTVSATLGNNLTSTGGLTVTDEGVVYSPSNTIPTLSDTKLSLGTNESSPGSFSGTAGGLSPNTTYYVAAYATNSAGTSYGSPVSFTTATPSTDASLAGLSTAPGTISPLFATGTTAYTDTVANSVTNVTITAATNNAFATVTMLTNGNQLSNGATATVPVNQGNNSIVITVTAQDGTTQSIYNLSMFRQPGLPVLTTTSPGSITSGSVVFGYHVTSTGGATLTDQGIVYSTSNTSPTTADTKVPFGNQTGTFFKFSSGLQAGTTYYAAAYATNAVGTTYGSPVSFTTLTNINSITAASSTPTNAASVNYTVTFASGVTGLSADNFTVTTTGTISGASVTSVNGSGAVYTVSVNTGSGDGTLTLNLDNATNLLPAISTSLPFAGNTYTIDKTAPTGNTISITSSGTQGASIAYIGDVVVYSFALSETPASTPTVTIDGRPADQVNLVFAPANAYEAILTMLPSYTAGNVAGVATVTDAAGNTAQISSASGATTVTYNNTPNLTVTGIFGAPETFVGTPGPSEMFTVSGYNLQSGGVLVTPPAGYEVSLDNSSFSSSVTAGNNNIVAPTNVYIRLSGVTAGFFSGNIVFSNGAIADVLEAVTTNETISALMSISAASSNPTNAASVDYTAKFISGIDGLSSSNFTITTTGSITGASVSSVTGSSGTYTVTVNTGTGDGTLTLNLANGPVDNQLPFAGDTYIIDKTAPAASPVTFTSNNANTAMAGVGDAVTLNFTTSEAVQAPVVTIAGQSISSTLASSSGNNYSYTAQYTLQASDGPDANGNVPYDVDLTDLAGNTASFTGLTTGVNVAFIPPSGNALLSIIKLIPALTFVNTGTTGATTTYTASVSNATGSATVTPTTQDPTATVKVNGLTVTSGTASGSIALAIGQTTINTVVTAQDGTTTRTYSITVTRAQSGDARLSTIALTPHASLLNTGTVGSTTTYTATVSNATTSVTVTPTAADPNATIQVNGVTVTSGTASGSIALGAEGSTTTITTIVTARDGTTTRTYSITVTRAPSGDPSLHTIVMSPYAGLVNTGTIGSTTTYTASFINAITSATVTPTAYDPNTIITVNGITVVSGTASGSIALAEGQTTVTIVATAQDGTTTHTYSIVVTRAPSSNALLSIIKLTPASLLTNTGAVGSTTTYTTSVSNATASVTITPTTQDATATIKVNGLSVTSGTASGSIALPVGQTVINTVVTAQDGTTTHTYSITVTRLPSSDALLSIIKLTPASVLTNTGTTGGATTYTTPVSNATTSVTVTPTAHDATATIKVNGTAVTSGTASGIIILAVGSNTITTIVTAQDGTTTHTYSITVTRAAGPLLSLYQPIQPVSVVKPADSVAIESDGVLVHQGVSPNGDGINDYLHIDGLAAYPDNNLMIIDRNGTIIFEAAGYDNNTKVFDGHSSINGRMQQPGTFFYSLDYVVNGQNKHKTGFILLKY